MNKNKYKFGLRKKLVWFTLILGIITYSTSGFFIYVLYPLFFEQFFENHTLYVILVLAAGAMWMGILAFFAAVLIIKPLKDLEEAAIKAAEGDMTVEVKVSKSDDEIRAVGLAFEYMLDNIRQMVQLINKNFTSTNEKVEIISAEATKATEQAENIGNTITEISQGAENSAESIQSIAESIEDVTNIANQVQMKAKDSEEKSNEMLDVLRESHKVITSLVNGIENISKSNRETIKSVNNLTDNANKIEQIIQLVGDIAEQTNLLALNASIEAARAGEHGKGFAVVAEEVRKLADESAKAVSGIAELIRSMQNEVSQVSNLINTQVESVDNEVKKGATTREMMEQMTQTIYQVADAVKEISLLVDKQMEYIHNTSMQSQEVSAISEETSAGAQEVAAAAQEQTVGIETVEQHIEELKDLANNLQQTITKFKIN